MALAARQNDPYGMDQGFTQIRLWWNTHHDDLQNLQKIPNMIKKNQLIRTSLYIYIYYIYILYIYIYYIYIYISFKNRPENHPKNHHPKIIQTHWSQPPFSTPFPALPGPMGAAGRAGHGRRTGLWSPRHLGIQQTLALFPGDLAATCCNNMANLCQSRIPCIFLLFFFLYISEPQWKFYVFALLFLDMALLFGIVVPKPRRKGIISGEMVVRLISSPTFQRWQ